MTSQRSGADDNGFASRPQVIGVRVERPSDEARSLELPGPSRVPPPVPLRTPQPPKKPPPPPPPPRKFAPKKPPEVEEEEDVTLFARCKPRKESAEDEVPEGTRLRPPLAVTGGVSADSGTGDTGSAEVQDSSGGKGGGGRRSVRPFTKDSRDRLESKTVHLVRDYGFQPKRKTSVEDGAVLPHKFEPFPSNLYGTPLEEIDSFIYDEVRGFSKV